MLAAVESPRRIVLAMKGASECRRVFVGVWIGRTRECTRRGARGGGTREGLVSDEGCANVAQAARVRVAWQGCVGVLELVSTHVAVDLAGEAMGRKRTRSARRESSFKSPPTPSVGLADSYLGRRVSSSTSTSHQQPSAVLTRSPPSLSPPSSSSSCAPPLPPSAWLDDVAC